MFQRMFAAAMMIGLASGAMAEGQAEYIKRLTIERGQSWETPSPFGTLFAPSTGVIEVSVSRDRAYVARMLARETERKLGAKWVNTALKIAHVESRFRCDAVGIRLKEGDRALGVGQVRIASARLLGYTGSAKGLLNCKTGIEMMLAHMSRCEAAGARTEAQMSRCHVAGWNSLGRRLAIRAENYARRYQRMVSDRRIRMARG